MVLPALRLQLTFHIVAFLAQALLIALIIRAAFFQRGNVIALSRYCYPALTHALSTQGISTK